MQLACITASLKSFLTILITVFVSFNLAYIKPFLQQMEKLKRNGKIYGKMQDRRSRDRRSERRSLYCDREVIADLQFKK